MTRGPPGSTLTATLLPSTPLVRSPLRRLWGRADLPRAADRPVDPTAHIPIGRRRGSCGVGCPRPVLIRCRSCAPSEQAGRCHVVNGLGSFRLLPHRFACDQCPLDQPPKSAPEGSVEALDDGTHIVYVSRPCFAELLGCDDIPFGHLHELPVYASADLLRKCFGLELADFGLQHEIGPQTDGLRADRYDALRILKRFDHRSEERREGKECVSQFRSRWSTYH